MAREIVETAEAILDKDFPVLDKGFVRMVDYLGGDQRIVQSARVSYGSGTKSFRQDRGLIHYLMRHEHTSPFEQVQLSFHLKMPIFVARQWIRHRTARLNEISARYSVMKDEFYLPEPGQVRFQSETNAQGRSEEALDPEAADRFIKKLRVEQEQNYLHYEDMLNQGIARELARTNLPVSLYTEMYWQIDLHNAFHFLRLRLDAHAQHEIREFAKAVAECVKAVAPIAYEAFEEQVLNGVRFSKAECLALQRMMQRRAHGLEGRVAREFEDKLAQMRRLAEQEEEKPTEDAPEPSTPTPGSEPPETEAEQVSPQVLESAPAVESVSGSPSEPNDLFAPVNT